MLLPIKPQRLKTIDLMKILNTVMTLQDTLMTGPMMKEEPMKDLLMITERIIETLNPPHIKVALKTEIRILQGREGTLKNIKATPLQKGVIYRKTGAHLNKILNGTVYLTRENKRLEEKFFKKESANRSKLACFLFKIS